MAPLLTINGIEVLCTASDWEPVRMGEVVRSINGWPRRTATVKKANYRFSSSLLTLAEAEALRGLVEGDGHVLSFEDASSASAHLYTSRETAPVYAAPGTLRVSTGGRWGAFLRITADDSVVWPVLPASTGPWSVLMWRNETSSGLWAHYLCRSDGAVFRNGVLDGAKTASTYVTRDLTYTTALALRGTASGNAEIDDVVMLPYLVPDVWALSLYTFHDTRAWPALPLVRAAGARLPAGGLDCIGEAGPGRTAAMLASSGESFDVTLYGT